MFSKLDLQHCKKNVLTNLPDNMKVRADLYLWNLGDLQDTMTGLTIDGNLVCNDTTTEKFLPSGVMIKGELELNGYSIRQLPENLKIGAGLYLDDTYKLSSLPKGLKVGRDLYIRTWKLNKIPSDLQVGGQIYYDSEHLDPEDFSIKLRNKLNGLFDGEW